MKKLILLGAVVVILFLIGFSVSRKQLSQSSPSNTPTTANRTSSGKLGGPLPFVLSAPSGFHIGLFVSGLNGSRDLQFSPDGTLLVSSPNSGEVIALPDKNQDGIADQTKVIISHENKPHGLAFYQNYLYVADVDRVVRYIWDEATLTATKDRSLFSLPTNSDHNARTLVINKGKLYVSVGSTCNVCREASAKSATVQVANLDGSDLHTYATGLRNAAFLAVNPTTDQIWSTEMGRDNLGDNLPPDEIDRLIEDGNYGWPYCYGNMIHDTNFDSEKTHSCADTISPIYQIPAHSAPLGLTFVSSKQFPDSWQGDLLVAYHGSWNRSAPVGYKIVHLSVNGGSVTDSDDFITGFLPGNATNGPSDASGRPVDLTFDKSGNLYISDDKAGNIYIVSRE